MAANINVTKFTDSLKRFKMPAKKSEALLEELGKTLEKDDAQREKLIKKIKGIVVFNIDGDDWTLDLRDGKGTLTKGAPSDKEDIKLTINDDNFVKLVMGKLNPQQAFIMRKLKIAGSMALAMKLQPILDAAQPKAKL